MYAMTGKLTAQPGKQEQLAAILLRAADLVATLPGCRQYAVCSDPADDHAVWVLEIWDDKASHDASLQEPGVRSLITAAMPLLGGPPSGSELRVIGGHGV